MGKVFFGDIAAGSFDEVRVTWDGVGFVGEDGFDVGAGKGWEDVEAVDFGVQSPYTINHKRIGGGPITADVVLVGGGEGDDFGFVKHPEEFEAAGGAERDTEAFLGLGSGFV